MWRIQAKHETVCPRCRGYIKLGAWIVQDTTYGKKWSHSVCPADVRRMANRSDEERAACEFQIKFGDGDESIATEAI
jgi:hypothetical protein